MKAKLVVLSASLLLIAGVLNAQMHGQMQQAGRSPMMHQGMGLNLTDEQKSKMEDLRLKHLKEVEPIRADIQKQFSTLKLEMTAEKFNESKAKSIQSEISKLQNDMATKRMSHMRGVRDMLTTEQQKKFDTGFLSGPGFGPGGMGGFGGRMGMMHGGRGMGTMPGGGGMGMKMGGGKCANCEMNR